MLMRQYELLSPALFMQQTSATAGLSSSVARRAFGTLLDKPAVAPVSSSTRDSIRVLLSITLLVALGSVSSTATAADRSPPTAVQAMIEDDWALQERRSGREPYGAEAIGDALRRTENLLDDLQNRSGAADFLKQRREIRNLREAAANVASRDAAARRVLYHKIRAVGRASALKNPAVAGRPVVFLKQHRFICQMMHEYVGYYYDYVDIAGGGVYVLKRPGESLEVRDLVADGLPRGNYATPAVSCDGKTIFFAFCPVRDVPRPEGLLVNWRHPPAPDRVPKELGYYAPGRNCFHIYAVGADGTNLRQLTHGSDDDFDPCPLPDGRVAFMSARRGGFCRCNNDFEPVPTYTLHRVDADGRNVRTLSYHETNEWHPSVLNDGRIVYCRWDYVDRSAAHFHGLWACNPDGTNPHILVGNYTQRISAFYQPRAVPGSDKIVFVAGAHHANVGGSLAMFDPRRAKLDPQTGEDCLDSIERLTPEVCFPETPNQWPKSYFNSPWPLSDTHFLVSFSFEPLPGMSSGYQQDAKTGIYYFDRFGNLELLYRDPELSCTGPMPLAPRPKPPEMPSTPDPELGQAGEFVLSNVNWSLLPMPQDRPIRKLRIFQVLPKTSTHVANRPRLGYANAESARMLLGEVPVEADGSAYFRAPARKLLYFQAVDGSGHAVQTMRSATYLQPGERRSCIGCHEPPATTSSAGSLMATRRPPSTIEPGPDGTRPWSYCRLVQPVLDRHCVRCHDGSAGPGKSRLALTSEPVGAFSRSYENLRPFVRWYEWGGKSIAQIVTRPGHGGADESRLVKILDDPTHATRAKLPAEDRRRLILWLDGNAPFYGVYGPEEQQAQRSGQSVPLPQVQ